MLEIKAIGVSALVTRLFRQLVDLETDLPVVPIPTNCGVRQVREACTFYHTHVGAKTVVKVPVIFSLQIMYPCGYCSQILIVKVPTKNFRHFHINSVHENVINCPTYV